MEHGRSCDVSSPGCCCFAGCAGCRGDADVFAIPCSVPGGLETCEEIAWVRVGNRNSKIEIGKCVGPRRQNLNLRDEGSLSVIHPAPRPRFTNRTWGTRPVHRHRSRHPATNEVAYDLFVNPIVELHKLEKHEKRLGDLTDVVHDVVTQMANLLYNFHLRFIRLCLAR